MGKHANKRRSKLEKRVRENSNDPEAWYKLGMYHHERGELSEAENCFKNALSITGNTHVGAMTSLGAIKLDEKKYSQTERLFRTALDIEPDNVNAITFLSMAMCYLNKLDDAIELAERATEIDPNDSPAWHQLCMAHYLKGDMKEAERAARSCVSEEPTNSDHWITLGMVLQNSGKLAEAEEAYKTSVRLDPFMPLGHKCLEQLYLFEGREEEAKLAWMPDLGVYAKGLDPDERKRLDEYLKVGRPSAQGFCRNDVSRR